MSDELNQNPNPDTAPVVATRPEWLPEAHWNGETNAIADDFGAHYGEIATFHKTQTEQQQALAARKPEDIKFEVKLPETVKLPEGFDIKINESDPRIGPVRDFAIKHGLTQDAVNDLIALDAMVGIASHTAEIDRLKAEDAKLGANAKARKDAVGNWLKGFKDRGDFSADEYEAVRAYAIDAASITALEKLMAKANGSVPGNQPLTDTKPAQEPITKRWYGGTTPQQKVS